jgi:hypothetical protein
MTDEETSTEGADAADEIRRALYVRTRKGWKRRGFLRSLIRRALRWLLK